MGRTEQGSQTWGITHGKNTAKAWLPRPRGTGLSVSAVLASEELLAVGTVSPRDPGVGP